MKDRAVILAILVIVGTAIGPAYQQTLAELADATDDSLTTAFQWDLIITSWGGAITDVCIGILLYYTRNQPAE